MLKISIYEYNNILLSSYYVCFSLELPGTCIPTEHMISHIIVVLYGAVLYGRRGQQFFNTGAENHLNLPFPQRSADWSIINANIYNFFGKNHVVAVETTLFF